MEIEVKSIRKSYGKKNVLRDISFSASAGECIGIIGANGCGKSTLFSILAGVRPGEGEFLLNGENLIKNHSLRNQSVAYIPQGTPLIDELTARDNLRLWYSKETIAEGLCEGGIIKRFGVGEFIDLPVRKLSGGMKKRLSIVCAVAHDPKIIIMDEPTAALDIVCKQAIKKYIEWCCSVGKTVLIATHDGTELEICDKVFIMKQGALSPFEYNGNIEEIAKCIS